MRYIVEIDFFIDGENAKEAAKEAQRITRELRDKYDNHAKVTNLFRNDFGSLKSKKINICGKCEMLGDSAPCDECYSKGLRLI